MAHRTILAAMVLAGFAMLMFQQPFHAAPAVSVYPTGTTIYAPDRAWNGYTVFGTPENDQTVLIDMNGKEVKTWTDITWSPAPPRILPGGYLLGGAGERPPHQEALALVQTDWNGKVVWRFDRTEEVKGEDGRVIWAARQHHDWQREGSPAGYYAPGSEPLTRSGRTLILAHKNVSRAEITDKTLEDDYLLEVSWSGDVVWTWLASDHFREFGFSAEALDAIRRSAGWNESRKSVDWLHINSASYVGPNRWYDAGDKRFHPDNVIISSREASIIAIIDRQGSIVWRMGPDYRETPKLRELGQLIGQHHPHIIPKGLPGAGNLLVFDNGGAAGYGFSNPRAPNGTSSVERRNSRVLEINPSTFDKVWEYSIAGVEDYRFFSHYVSSAQRLPNGNTFITEGADGRLFEVTSSGDIVWEYVSPYFGRKATHTNRVYRAYRLPYDWIPQLAKPAEQRVVPPDLSKFHVAP